MGDQVVYQEFYNSIFLEHIFITYSFFSVMFQLRRILELIRAGSERIKKPESPHATGTVAQLKKPKSPHATGTVTQLLNKVSFYREL